MVDLKTIASLDPRGAERAKTTPLAASGLFDDDSPVSQAPYSSQLSGPLSGQLSGPLSGRVSDRGGLSAPPPPSSVEGLGRPSIPSERPPMVAHASAQAESAPMSLRPHGYVSQPPPSVTGFVGAPISARAMMSSDVALPTTTRKRSGGGMLLLIGGVVTLAAAAAGGVFYMKSHNASLASSKPSTVVETTPAAALPATPAAAATVAAGSVAASDPVPAVDDAVSPDSLAVGSKDSPVAAKGAKHAVAAKPVTKAESKAVEPATAAPTTKKPEAKVAATAPTSAGELGAAMQKAAGPADAVAVEEKAAGPQFAPGSVPQKPANGTVMGAIGAALPGARACLGPDDPVSRATITFQSTGAVQSVNVSGGAAGKPAEACIKTALGKAKVPPFAEATFTTAVTVRP